MTLMVHYSLSLHSVTFYNRFFSGFFHPLEFLDAFQFLISCVTKWFSFQLMVIVLKWVFGSVNLVIALLDLLFLYQILQSQMYCLKNLSLKSQVFEEVSEVPNVRGIIAFTLRLHESLKTGVWFMILSICFLKRRILLSYDFVS